MIGLLATSRQRSHDPWSYVQSKAGSIGYKGSFRKNGSRSEHRPAGGGTLVAERSECREKQNRLHLGRCVGSGGCGNPSQYQQRRLAPASGRAQARVMVHWTDKGQLRLLLETPSNRVLSGSGSTLVQSRRNHGNQYHPHAGGERTIHDRNEGAGCCRCQHLFQGL